MVNGKDVPKMDKPESRKEFVHRKFQDRMKEFAKTLKEKQARSKVLIAKKTLSKEDQQELSFLLDWLTSETASNIPFFSQCFQENMDEVVGEAKLEIENAIQHKINMLGLRAVKAENDAIQLEQKTDNKT